MADLFRGSDIAHGRSQMTDKVTTKGKHEAKSWTEKRPATLADWAAHLAGTAGIGIPPLDSNNCVQFGAIDVDLYGLSIETVNSTIQEMKLPLVICRSKSGGPHIFLFLTAPVPAADMIEKLDSLAGCLGFGTSEIFPKQASIHQGEGSKDFGSWINMPYFGGTRFLRYGLDQDSKALGTVADFHAYATARRLTPEQFAALQTPEPEALFPDGPPCLNQIFAENPNDNRNILLSNAAVYAKKAFPQDWKLKLDSYNTKFTEPLGSAEVEALKKSYEKKDYRYQCNKPPLCNFCDSSRCRKTKFGVGGGELMPASRSLTKVETTPAIWYMDIIKPDGTTARVSMNTEELQTPRLFQRRCMETIHVMPPLMKIEEWGPMVQDLMKHVDIIHLPPQMTPKGHFLELFWEWLRLRADSSGREVLLTHQPYKDESHYYFRFGDLKKHLKAQGFTELTSGAMGAVLQTDLRCVSSKTTVNGHTLEYSAVPIPSDHTPTEPLAQPVFEPIY